MKIILQRCSQASVSVEGETLASIEKGYMLLVGVGLNDTIEDIDYLCNKIINMRIFADEQDKMNLSIKDVNGSILSISQFTLFANTKKGNRPSFTESAPFAVAQKMYHLFNETLTAKGVVVKEGQFGANMQIALINDGPVTIILDSKQ